VGSEKGGKFFNSEVAELIWLGGRDSNPDRQIQSLQSYRWTTSQHKEGTSKTQQGFSIDGEPLSIGRLLDLLDAIDAIIQFHQNIFRAGERRLVRSKIFSQAFKLR
jgi:hypothetical protein